MTMPLSIALKQEMVDRLTGKNAVSAVQLVRESGIVIVLVAPAQIDPGEFRECADFFMLISRPLALRSPLRLAFEGALSSAAAGPTGTRIGPGRYRG